MGKLQVIKRGMQSTIQDLGRFGYRKIGVPISGAMDSKSLKDANTIIGNPEIYPAIEHTLYGGIYRFHDPCVISVTGAKCNPTINGVLFDQYIPVEISSGDELEIHHPVRGCRSYLAIQGKPEIPVIMKSYSTYLPGKFGGFNGRKLEAGDEIVWNSNPEFTSHYTLSNEEIPYFSTKISIKIKSGPEFDLLDDKAKDQLTGSPFKVSTDSNRMGIRLIGNEIQFPNIEMSSAPVIPGIIQLPSSGNPIILMKDGQTIGGYPRIGIVDESELWRLGQVKGGDNITFNIVD